MAIDFFLKHLLDLKVINLVLVYFLCASLLKIGQNLVLQLGNYATISEQLMKDTVLLKIASNNSKTKNQEQRAKDNLSIADHVLSFIFFYNIFL